MNFFEIANKLANLLLTFAKSFWSATVQTAWGITTFFLLAAITTYYNSDTTMITGLFQIIYSLMSHWQLVWGVIFLYYLIVGYAELSYARLKK